MEASIIRNSANPILVHFDDTRLPAERVAAGSGLHRHVSLVERIDWVQWFCRWSADQQDPLHLLLPESWMELEQLPPSGLGNASVIWCADPPSCELPEFDDDDNVWIVNAESMQIVDWEAARPAARRRHCDILVFGSSEPATDIQYRESVQVDESGGVVQFRRHYVDSPELPEILPESASYLVCSGVHARAVVAHLVTYGWGLDSIGGLTRRFHIGWFEGDVGVDDNGLAAKTAHAVKSGGDDGSSYRFVKRAVDIIFSATAILLLLPLLLVVAALVKITSRGPVFFGHRRQGLGGKEFKCLKFRTMIEGADAMQARLRAENEVDGPQFKLSKDPRSTRLGIFLQRYNIDEIPQFINVLRGEMSLVGPRPSPDRENQFCPGWRRARLSVRPGITGLWQVLRLRDHSDSDFQEWIFYDLEYARHRCLWLDWQILWQTPVSMFAHGRLGHFAERLRKRGICVHSAWIAESNSSSWHSTSETHEGGTEAA